MYWVQFSSKFYPISWSYFSAHCCRYWQIWLDSRARAIGKSLRLSTCFLSLSLLLRLKKPISLEIVLHSHVIHTLSSLLFVQNQFHLFQLYFVAFFNEIMNAYNISLWYSYFTSFFQTISVMLSCSFSFLFFICEYYKLLFISSSLSFFSYTNSTYKTFKFLNQIFVNHRPLEDLHVPNKWWLH